MSIVNDPPAPGARPWLREQLDLPLDDDTLIGPAPHLDEGLLDYGLELLAQLDALPGEPALDIEELDAVAVALATCWLASRRAPWSRARWVGLTATEAAGQLGQEYGVAVEALDLVAAALVLGVGLRVEVPGVVRLAVQRTRGRAEPAALH